MDAPESSIGVEPVLFFIDRLFVLKSVPGTHISSGFVHTQHSDPSGELDQPIALRLIQKNSNSGDVTLAKITLLLEGICIA